MSEPKLARLHETRNCHASWCGSVGAWLQIDLGRDHNIDGIHTQGARDNYGFVKKFTLSYRTMSGEWQKFEEDGNVKVILHIRKTNWLKAELTAEPF